MSEFWYGMAVVAVCASVTMLIRALPFVAFGSGKLPPAVEYVGKMLPRAVMVTLIVFCLRNTSFSTGSHGIPEIGCSLLCAVLQKKLNNAIPSIAISTILYMVLIRFVFV